VPELKVDKSVEKWGTRWEGEKSHNFKISSSKSIQGDKQEVSDKVDCGIYNIYKELELLKKSAALMFLPKITYRPDPLLVGLVEVEDT
jgi:hypothetical protein